MHQHSKYKAAEYSSQEETPICVQFATRDQIEALEEKYKEFLKKREEYVKGNIKRLMDGKEYFKDKNNKYKSITKSDLANITYDELKSWLMTKTNQANDKAMLDIFKGKQRENTPERRIETSDGKVKKINSN